MSPIADDIFVGSVSVGVVPDLRGFNDRLRAELIPIGNSVGRDIGKEISKGIADNLDIGGIVTRNITRSLPAVRAAGKVMGDAYGKSFTGSFKAATKDMAVKVSVDKTSIEKMRGVIDLALRDAFTIKVKADIDQTSLLKIALAARVAASGGTAGGGGGAGVTPLDDLINRLIRGGGGGGGSRGGGLGSAAAAGSSGGFISGIGSLLKALPGGTSGSIAAVPPQVAIPAGILAAASLPFVAQAGGGLLTGALGTGLAGLGVAGAFGLGGQTAQQIAPLKGAAQVASQRVVVDQARLNTLRASGKTTTAQLQSAELTLASARNSQANAQQKYQIAQKDQITSGQEAVRASLKNLANDAQDSLTRIGVAFVPVMQNIFGIADKTMKSMTPVFANAEKIIAGPFQTIVDTVLKAFTDPQVKQSIGAVATAFGNILKAFTPDIAGIMNSFADAITRMATSISKNPKAFADFLNFIAQFIIMLIDGIAFLTDFADYVELHFMPAVQHFIRFWQDVWRDVSAAPGIALRFVKSEVETIWADITGVFAKGTGAAGGAAAGIGNKLIAPFMFVYHWVESWFKPWWKANGQALIDIWQSTWFYMSTIVKGLVIGPIVLAARIFWNVLSAVFRAGSEVVSTLWRFLWGIISTTMTFVTRIVIGILKIFWADIQSIFRISAAVIHLIWSNIWSVVELIARLAWDNLRFIVKTGWDVIVGIFTIFINLITGRWGAAWDALRNMAIQIWNNLRQYFQAVWQAISDYFIQVWNNIRLAAIQIWNSIKQASIQVWNAIWNDIVSNAVRSANSLFNVFQNLKQRIIGWFNDAIHWLVNAGSNIITGLLNGIKSSMGSIGSWIKANVVDPLVNAVKHFFGIHSPASLMVPIGANIMKGVFKGIFAAGSDLGGMMKVIFGSWPEALGAMIGKSLIDLAKLPAKALHALGSVAGKIGGFFSHLFSGGPAGAGVQRWAGTVAGALALLGQPSSLIGRVLYQMQTESGGNPNAINLWDSNAAAGDPSRGLMQVIGSTFAAYHVAGTSTNIYDPLANIAAAINYALHRYGPTLGALGSGHGYAGGTSGAAAGWAWVGENGPELVRFRGGEDVVPMGGLGGYATGTSVATLEAEIRRYQATINLERHRITSYSGAAGAAERRLISAQIAVNQSHINDLQKRIYAMEHAVTVTAAQRIGTATYNKMVTAGTSLAAALAKITTGTTASGFAGDQTKFLADLRLYFSPATAQARSNLVIGQIKEMQNLQTHIKTLTTNIAKANTFQQQELAHLQTYGGVTQIGLQGTGAQQGRTLLSGLRLQIGVLNNFGATLKGLRAAGASTSILTQVAGMDPAAGTDYGRKMITALNKMKALKLPAGMMAQLIATGPDSAIAYADALRAAGPSTLKGIIGAETTLEAARLAVSRGAASVVSGGAYVTGANFVAGLKSQQKALESQFAHLGKVLGEEAIKWMRVPYNKRPYGYATGGWINEPISGVGMYSGALYTFAEKGREYVVPEGAMGSRGGDGAAQYHAHFDGLTGAAIEHHVRTAFRAMSMTQGSLQRQGRRT